MVKLIVNAGGGMLKNNIEKVLGILLIALLAFNFFFLLHINNSMNEKQKQLEERLTKLSSQIGDLQENNSTTGNSSADKTIDFLKQEYINYKDFANNDRESFMNLVSLFFVALAVLVTGGTIVLWIFGQTKTEVKENANLTIKSSINEIKESADSTVKDSVKVIEEEAKTKIKLLIDPKMEDFEAKYSELERFMENQHSLRKSRVMVLSPQDKKEEMERLEVMRIRRIVDEARLLSLENFKEFDQAIASGEIDIIIYRYEKAGGKKQEETIRKYIKKLKDLDLEIPIVVYAPHGTRVDGEDLHSVNSYPFSVMANMPTSLTSNMMSLANALSYERGN